MKTHRIACFVTVALSLVTFSVAGCAEKEKPADASLPSAIAPESAPVAPKVGSDVSSAEWADIKEVVYDNRPQFFTGLKRLEARVDAQVAELVAKRATMKGATDTKDWDFAMKEMGNARTYLKSMGEELSKASREMWDQQKDKVGLAWVRVQAAYDKVKASTTG